MKKISKSVALVLALVMILQIMPMTAKAEDQANERPNTLYVFDLETFLETLPSSKVRYDYLKLATALQGLVNRDIPRLYYYFMDGDEAEKVNWDMDAYWLQELSKNNAYLAGCTQVSVSDFWSLLTTFADDYHGIVLWDENVPATANVASTIAGVENLLPVRYATGTDDLYTAMLTKGFTESDVKKNLVGMFTGTGTIPDSATASTGSAKNDAYIWAKEQYMDTGKTNPLLMTYSIDGSSWNFDDEGGGLRNAKFISAAIPATMQPNEIVPISVTVENTGTETWRRNSYYRLGLTNYGTFGFYNDAEGTSGVTSNRDRLAVTSDVAPGERYTFVGYLKAPEAAGFYDVGMGMILDGVEWFGKKYFPSICVAEDAGDTGAEIPVTCEPVEDKSGFNAMIVSAAIPDKMAPGEIVKVKFTVKNTGTQPLYCNPNGSNGQKIGLAGSAPFKLCTAEDGTSTDSGSLNRMKIKTRTASEETYTIVCYLKAPDTVGTHVLQLQAVDEGTATKVGWFGSRFEKSITVYDDSLTEAPVTCEPVADKSGFNAMIVSAAIPDRMAPGEIVKVKFTVKNTGTQPLYCNPNGSNGQKIGLTGAAPFKLCTAENGTSTDSGSLNRIKIKTRTASEETYTIVCYLKAPDTVGTHVLQLQAVDEGTATKVGWFGSRFEKSITVYDDSLTEAPVTCEPVADKSGFNAMIVSAAIPDRMAPGEIVKVKFTVKNTGTETLYCNPNGAIGQKIGLAGSAPFKLCTAADGTSTDSGSLNRIKIKTRTASTETYTIECYLKAPDTAGSYPLQLQTVDEGTVTKVGWFGSRFEKAITVTDMPAETPISGAGIVYDNLFNTALPNADYYIANKAFFWDLSPDDSIAPIDDRTQPVGTDVATLRKLLLSQAKQAEAAAAKGNGTGFYTVGGFVPWTLKYTTFADPQSNMENVSAEFAMVEHISTYHGQTDADAYGTVGLANASVFSHVPLKDGLKQNNDKGASSAVTYEKDTAYLLFYMGDWDGAAWVNGIMPFIWKESQEDAAAHPENPLPLAWPINACLADRIPQMYNMLYETAGATDYFVTGDNGTGYLNPMFLEGSYVPDGLENYLDEWVAHNIAANKKFDLDITGFLIEGSLSSTSGCTETVRQAYSRMTPFGVVASNRYDNIVNGDVTTPFPAMTSLPNMRTETQRQQAATQIAGNIKFDGQFFVYRSVKASRANVRETLRILEAQNPGIKYEVVDPYTFMKLYAQHADFSGTNTGAVYEADKVAAPITVDGTASVGEWDEAETMVVSAASRQVSNHGYVWGSFAGEEDLTAIYRLAWDSENLYMLEERVDNYWKPAYTVGANPLYDVDATMLFLDLDGLRDGTKFFPGDFAIHYSFDAEGMPVVYLRTGTDTGSKNHTLLREGDVQIARTATSDGYICEIAIPWSLLTNDSFRFTPQAGSQVGMTILAIDHDESTSGGRQIMWHGNGDTQDNWGVLKFVTSEPKIHNVQLPDIYIGETSVEEGNDYTFRVRDGENYRYDTPAATVGGEAAIVADHGDGSYTIRNIQGDVIITGTRAPKSYRVTFQGNAGAEVTDGAATATYGTDYVFTLPSAEHYSYTLTGIQENSTGNAVAYTKDARGTVTIAGSHIHDDMTITIDKARSDSDAAEVKTGDRNGDLLMLAAVALLSLLLLAVLGRIVWVSRNRKSRT